jgi:hypothetical protein
MTPDQQRSTIDGATSLTPDQKAAVKKKLGLPDQPQGAHFNLGPIHF